MPSCCVRPCRVSHHPRIVTCASQEDSMQNGWSASRFVDLMKGNITIECWQPVSLIRPDRVALMCSLHDAGVFQAMVFNENGQCLMPTWFIRIFPGVYSQLTVFVRRWDIYKHVESVLPPDASLPGLHVDIANAGHRQCMAELNTFKHHTIFYRHPG